MRAPHSCITSSGSTSRPVSFNRENRRNANWIYSSARAGSRARRSSAERHYTLFLKASIYLIRGAKLNNNNTAPQHPLLNQGSQNPRSTAQKSPTSPMLPSSEAATTSPGFSKEKRPIESMETGPR